MVGGEKLFDDEDLINAMKKPVIPVSCTQIIEELRLYPPAWITQQIDQLKNLQIT